MLTSIDLKGIDLPGSRRFLPNTGGDFVGGRSFVKDMLTGTVYAIRDLRTEYYDGARHESVLCTIGLGTACATPVQRDRHRTGSQQPVPEISAALRLQQGLAPGLSWGQIDRERFGRLGDMLVRPYGQPWHGQHRPSCTPLSPREARRASVPVQRWVACTLEETRMGGKYGGKNMIY